MKIIEAMKQIERLQEKAEDYRAKAAKYSVDYDSETPTYGSVEQQKEQVREWVQGHSDILKEILKLKVNIQRTNLITIVPIQIGDQTVSKSISEWIYRRRDLAKEDREMFAGLGRKESSMKEGVETSSTGDKTEKKIRRYYNPAERDKMVAIFREEPSLIDGTLEVVNAVTDLIES